MGRTTAAPHLLLLLLLSDTARAQPGERLPATFTISLHGGQIQHNASAAHLSRLARLRQDLGARGFRIDLFWDDLQPANGSGWDAQKVAFYRAFYAAQRGGSVIILGGPPAWAKALYAHSAAAFLAAWQRYLTKACAIVGDSQVIAWQLWNEMNHEPSRWIHNDDATVRAVFALAGQAVRQSPELGNSGKSAPRYVNVMADDHLGVLGMIPWEEALDRWIGRSEGQHSASAAAVDGIGIDHYPGTWTLDPAYGEWRPLSTLLARVSERNNSWFGKRVSIMETGYSTWNKVLATDRMQVEWCNRSLAELCAVMRRTGRPTGGVELINFYQLIDQGAEGGFRLGRSGSGGDGEDSAWGWAPPEEAHFGVVRVDGVTKKPGFEALRRGMAVFARGQC